MALQEPSGVTVAEVAHDDNRGPGLWTYWPTRAWWIEAGGWRVLDHSAFASLFPEARVVAVAVAVAIPERTDGQLRHDAELDTAEGFRAALLLAAQHRSGFMLAGVHYEPALQRITTDDYDGLAL